MKPGALDRVKTNLARVIDSVTKRIDYLALYPSKVVAQNADGTLELRPDDTRIPGLSKVPVRHGLPGVAVKVSAGARVLLGFEGGSPTLPYAALWEFDGTKLLELAIGDGPTSFVALAQQVTARLDALQASFNAAAAHTHAVSGALASPSTNFGSVTGSNNVASTKVKST